MHTPTPWKVDESQPEQLAVIEDNEDGEGICEMDHSVKDPVACQANAAFIVQAVNAHERLVSALQDCLQALRHAPIEGCYGKDARYKAEQVLAELEGD